MKTWLSALQVRPEQIELFLNSAAPYAGACMQEPGLVSFALLRELDVPYYFSMFEVFHDEQAWQTHLASEHYQIWQKELDLLLVKPVKSKSYIPVFPPPEDWERHLEAS